MKFERLTLENFKCFGSADLSLSEGVTVIHGLNGSGKSSLLEACFFSLYGARALDGTLDEIVTIGESEMRTALSFSHAGVSYDIEREVRVTDGDARTASCVLSGPEGTVEGVTDVREQVTDLLRMDAEAFVNCAYVRQGEVNKLIEADPATRQDMIDDLLQLGSLEEYRERASDARVGVGRVRDDTEGALGEVEGQIADKEASNLHERANECRTELAEVTGDIERYEDNRETARETLDHAEEILAEYEDRREELDTLEGDIEELRAQISETARERESLADRIEEHRQVLADLRERRGDLLAADALGAGGVAASNGETQEGPGGGSAEGTESDEHREIDFSAFEGTGELSESAREELRAGVRDALASVRESAEALTDSIREVSVQKQEHDSERETLAEQAEGLEAEATEKRAEADELETDLSAGKTRLENGREELEELAADIESKRAAFADAPVDIGDAEAHRESVAADLADCRERRAEVETDLENARERLEEAISLREAGKCPECGQPVADSPHVDAIAEREETVESLETTLADRRSREAELEESLEAARELVERESAVERLESERKNLTSLLEEREENLAETEARIERLREAADEHEAEAEQLRDRAEESASRAAECREEIAEYNRQKRALDERREALQALSAVLEEVADEAATLESLREQRSRLADLNDERRERLGELRDRRATLRDSVDEDRVTEARENREEAAAYLDDVAETLEELRTRRDDLQAEIGALENEIEALERLRERRDDLTATVDNLDSLYAETARLEEMYGTLRAELRQQNVETLERMLNETFDLLYQNDTYARIELDGEYRLTIYQKDGEALDPGQLSGGERALFNLSLRCAIYRLLAEGIEGTAPMPPLILDEPTVFLDSGHVSQLLELIASMYDLGVAQILVVSHDEELVAAADDAVTVRKDSTTNRSTIQRGVDGARALVAPSE